MQSTLLAADHPPGWVLVESRFERRGRHQVARLLVRTRSNPDHVEEIPLPVLADGRIRELVNLPGDIATLEWQFSKSAGPQAPALHIRPLGWSSRALHMASRVVRTYARLSGHQRQESGLTLWRLISDLPGAYRVATGFRARYPVVDYADWIERYDTIQWQDTLRIQAHIARFTAHPHFHLLLATDARGQEPVQATLESLRRQLYRNFTCTVLGGAGVPQQDLGVEFALQDMNLRSHVVSTQAVPAWLSEFNATLAGDKADEWVMILRAGDTLPTHALYWFAYEIQAQPDSAVFYSDDDALDAEGRRSQPRFKPDWSLAHLHATHYVGSAAVLRGREIAAAGGVGLDCCRHGNYDLLLRVADPAGENVTHVPAVLLHRDTDTRGSSAWEDPQWCAGTALMHLARKGVAAEVAQTQSACRRIRYRLPDAPPLVSIIVPTRDHLPLLRECVESVRGRTTYPRFETLVFDNQTTDPDALSYLDSLARYPAMRVLRYDRPFNYSKINNVAAREARGEVLCLLNNDTWVLSPDWLEEMVGHLLQERVGAVGAKLYYPDTRVQHAGVTVGPGGCADHLHLGLGCDEPGYCDRAAVAQELSAVTGACLVTWKHLYEQLGGLNEESLTVAFNDVDYCLRLQEAGHRVIFTPHAELIHHESATRGRDTGLPRRMRANREISYMRLRWGKRMRHDPYYNPNLSYQRPDFSLSETPRVRKPWL
jgi:GT2 family glycosyltransferase